MRFCLTQTRQADVMNPARVVHCIVRSRVVGLKHLRQIRAPRGALIIHVIDPFLRAGGGRLRCNPRKGKGGLKGITAVFALPKMAHAALINVFRPFRHEQLLATLGAFGYRAWGSNFWDNAVGIKGHGPFLTRLAGAYNARLFWLPSQFSLGKNSCE